MAFYVARLVLEMNHFKNDEQVFKFKWLLLSFKQYTVQYTVKRNNIPPGPRCYIYIRHQHTDYIMCKSVHVQHLLQYKPQYTAFNIRVQTLTAFRNSFSDIT